MSVANDLILQIERGFQELRKEYMLFLNDAVLVEPLELREGLNETIKRLRNLTNLRTEEQFRANSIIAKVQSHLQLWDRQVMKKHSGTLYPRRPKDTEEEDDSKPAAKAREKVDNQKVVRLSNAVDQRERVVELFDEYMRLNLQLGSSKMANFGKFQSFIDQQTQKIRDKKGAKEVAYEVLVQDGKVVIKSKSVK